MHLKASAQPVATRIHRNGLKSYCMKIQKIVNFLKTTAAKHDGCARAFKEAIRYFYLCLRLQS